MWNLLKKLSFLLPFLTAACFFQGCKNTPQKRVGVIQIIEHPALNQTCKGIRDELENQGFKNSQNLEWLWESAMGTPSQAVQIAQKYVGQKVDVIVAIGTTAAQAAVSITKGSSIPVVFSSVSSPGDAGLTQTGKESRLTGVSNKAKVGGQFALFLKLLSHVRPLRLGVIYNPGEANSASNNADMKRVASEEFKEIELVFAAATKTSEVSVAAQSLVGKVDALFVNNDNTALSAFESIVTVARANKIPAFVSDIDLLDRGALAAHGPNQYELGRQTGMIVADLLYGKRKPGEIAIQYPDRLENRVNRKAAEEIGLTIPESLSD